MVVKFSADRQSVPSLIELLLWVGMVHVERFPDIPCCSSFTLFVRKKTAISSLLHMGSAIFLTALFLSHLRI